MKTWKALGAAVGMVLIGSLTLAAPGGQAVVGKAPQAVDRTKLTQDSVRAQLGISSGERLVVKDVIRDADGTVHRRYDRTYRGLRVIAGDLIVHRSPLGKIAVDWASKANLGAITTLAPRVSAAAAARLAARTTQLRSTARDAELVIYAVGDKARLAWQATASGPDAREVTFVDADSGRRIAGWSEIDSADGKGKSLYSGTVKFQTVKKSATKYLLQDKSRGNHRVFDALNGTADPPTGVLMKDKDNVWGNYKTSSRQSAAADVAYGHTKTWDFYKNVFNRNGIRGNGTTPKSYVHQGVNFKNAYYDNACYCMVYGDGGSTFRPLVSLDVVAHEMSHGTTAATANLIYFGESGGLNEATSDIFGSMAEFYANNTNDRGDYYVGEKVVKVAPHFLRRMDNPQLDGASYNCWTPTMGADDVHFSSGPANHFFYLLAEGSGSKVIGGRNHNSPTCNGSNFGGIGRTPAGKIWYRALRTYMTSTTNYMVARDATIRAARYLYGPASTQCAKVVMAWKAVDAPSGGWACAGAPPAQGTNVVANPGFESGSTSWSDPDGVITTSAGAFPRSGSWYAWLNGFGFATTHTLSQVITVPNSPTAKLRFWVLINTSEGGGVFDTLAVQVVSGVTTTTLDTYTNADANNTYTRKTLDLSTWAGSSVTLKFLGDEDSSAQTSFLLDDVAATPS